MRNAGAPAEVFLRRELRGPVLFIARGIVALYVLLAVFIYLRSIPGWVSGQLASATAAAGSSGGTGGYRAAALVATGISILSAFTWIVLAGLVFLRRSRDPLGLFLSSGFLSFGIVMGTFIDYGSLVAAGKLNPWAPPWQAVLLPLANALSLPWAYFFPDGRFVPRWSFALAALWALVWLTPAVGGPAIGQTPLGNVGTRVVIITLVASTAAAILFRYWRRSTVVQRQQLKWCMLGALVFVAVYLFLVPTGSLIPQAGQTGQAFLFQMLHLTLFWLAVIAVPIAIGIAIFRQGLLDIDFIINRTLTYVAVTAILAIALVAISSSANWLLGGLTGQRSELVLLASVIPVAIAFMPLRARALKIADRFVVDRKVTTLLFVDLVGSTELAYALGDQAWRQLLERFRSTVRRSLKRHGGKEIDTAGDGFFVTFEAPGQALACARELVESSRQLGLEVRVGVHIGEVQVDGSHVTGAAVHLASRVMSAAGPGEVLVSRALRDVLAGSDFELDDRGSRQLKGVPGEVQLFAAVA